MSSKKLYIAIARAFALENEYIANPKPVGRDIELVQMLETKRWLLAHAVARVLQDDNDAFDKEKFFFECQLSE